MRSESEMMRLIIEFARSNQAIRAVIMNGSRVNPNAPKDPFQDFDIACLVTDVAPFRQRQDIPAYFGELMILQLPNDMGDPPPDGDGSYAYLMQFMDGNRIDLSFHPLEKEQILVEDSLSVVLLDKDRRYPDLPPPDDHSYYPLPPTAKNFDDCCNEFWWVNPYAAKGLWRDELTYARYMLDTVVREQFMKMVDWYFGVQTGFQKSPGKLGKYLKRQLDPSVWAQIENTYASSRADAAWQALFTMNDLFRSLALEVAQHFGFTYPAEDDRRVSAFIRLIHDLPRDARTIP